MFLRSMSQKEVDFVSYIDSKFADLKEKFVEKKKRFAVKHNVVNK